MTGQQKARRGDKILRRQAKGGLMPAGSSRALRLDPFSLPLRFRAGDAGADERRRDVELYRERVVVRRWVRGIPMTLNLPMADFLGVALRVIRQDEAETVSLTLEHPDPGLSITLYRSGDSDDVVAEWQSWAKILQRPLLVTDDSGALHELFARLGPLRLGAVASRRRRRTAMKGRRPSIGWRRRNGVAAVMVLRAGEEHD
ncbi:MAG TPA: DUF6101 family protein [Xanthobacteraceae bacterium]|nr:DUF6101 family protein [Xanthobacteraceae bacterium]